MLTLGTGVGGGIILNRARIYVEEGIADASWDIWLSWRNGEPCTCGRRGCLEAYASATALKRDARRVSGKDLDPEKSLPLQNREML